MIGAARARRISAASSRCADHHCRNGDATVSPKATRLSRTSEQGLQSPLLSSSRVRPLRRFRQHGRWSQRDSGRRTVAIKSRISVPHNSRSIPSRDSSPVSKLLFRTPQKCQIPFPPFYLVSVWADCHTGGYCFAVQSFHCQSFHYWPPSISISPFQLSSFFGCCDRSPAPTSMPRAQGGDGFQVGSYEMRSQTHITPRVAVEEDCRAHRRPCHLFILSPKVPTLIPSNGSAKHIGTFGLRWRDGVPVLALVCCFRTSLFWETGQSV